VIRDLLTGGKRFNDLVDRLGGITPKTLSQRLRELEDAGLVTADREAGQPPHAEHLLGAVTGPSNSPPATPAQPAGTSVSTVRTTWSKATVAGGRAPRVLRLLLPGCSSRAAPPGVRVTATTQALAGFIFAGSEGGVDIAGEAGPVQQFRQLIAAAAAVPSHSSCCYCPACAR
jgi:hypothetical protein